MPATLKQTAHSSIPSLAEIVIVQPKGLAEVWAGAGLFIQRMLKRGEGELNLVDGFENIRNGKWDLWLGFRFGNMEACLLGQAINHPRYSTYLIVGFATDDMKFWLPHLETIEQWAAQKGFTAITERGRKGWFRKLPGWRLSTIEMRKDLR